MPSSVGFNLFVLAVIFGVFFMGGRKYAELRGLRLNNPGNIKISDGNAWLGKVTPSSDEVFEQFVSPEYGIRAMGKLINFYFSEHGLDDIYKIVSRYAPASENNTRAYAEAVASELGIGITALILVPKEIDRIVAAMIRQEQGQQPFSDEFIHNAILLEAA